MNDKDKLAELFKKMPGIGPRQAKRMVYFLLSADKQTIDDMTALIGEIQKSVSICPLCFRYFEKKADTAVKKEVCSICQNQSRDKSILMIVGRDVDHEAVEKSGVYKGNYFVLGGTIPFLSNNPEKMVKVKELLSVLPKRLDEGLKEIIFALNATPEGEHTMQIVEDKLKEFLASQPKSGSRSIVISKLGRGFSTGTEVEYSDRETLKSAISSRFLS